MEKINVRTIDATIKVIENLKIKANDEYTNLKEYANEEKELKMFMDNFNQTIESIKAKRINKKNFKKYTTANMKTIIEEINKVTKSKNEKLTEIIQKAINVKQSWSEYLNYSNSSVQIVLFVFVFVWFLQVK